MNIFDLIFGNKVKVVTATKIWGFAKWKQQFLFHKDISNETIRKFLYDKTSYSVDEIKNTRSKKIISPDKNHFKPFTEQKIVFFYD